MGIERSQPSLCLSLSKFYTSLLEGVALGSKIVLPPPRNRLSPCHINIKFTRYNDTTDEATTQIKHKRRTREKKQMPTPADQQNEDDSQSLNPLNLSLHAPNTPERRIPSSTFKKECDDDVTAARTCPRVSPKHTEVNGKRVPGTFHEGMAAPMGVTASLPDKPTGISLDPKKNHYLGHSLANPTQMYYVIKLCFS